MRGHEAPRAAALAGGAPGSREGTGRVAVPGAGTLMTELAPAARTARRNGGPALPAGRPAQVRG